MIVLSANNLSKVYGTDVILEKVSFHINQGDRVGIIGRNGAGKTTLLNLLTGELSSDEGEFFIGQNLKVGYLKQRDSFSPELTIEEAIDGLFSHIHKLEKEIAEASDLVAANPTEERLVHRLYNLQQEYEVKGGYTYKSEISGVLTSMAFGKESRIKKIGSLSGGEKTRLALAALLLEKPDILMLDEPTNHLDIGTLKWLEQYLSQYKGTLVIVSHDRYFLDQVVNRIFEVEHHQVTCYKGKYSQYADQKRIMRESQLKAYNAQQKEIRRQEDMIRIMKEHNTEHLVKRAKSREKRLDMVKRIDKPRELQSSMKIDFKQDFQSGNDVIQGKALSMSFGSGANRRELFRNVNLDIKRGDKICIVGPNGVGKTTLLRMILGELAPVLGNLKVGHNVAFGYYDQGQLLLNNSNTVFEEMKESYRLYNNTEMRSILGRFLFKGEDVFLNVGSLSGGEKARLSLAKLMLSGANTLILDEPTNHLDIESKEVFEEALKDFDGTAIIVSHDRYFLQKIPNKILELNSDGMVEYLGKYDYYLEKREEIASAGKYVSSLANLGKNKNSELPKSEDKMTTERNEPLEVDSLEGLSSAEIRAIKKQQEAEERRRARLIESLEKEIETLERRLKELEVEMSKEANMADFEVLGELSREHEDVGNRLEEVYDQWAEVQGSI